MRLVYLIGDPGVGKTTLMRGLIDRLATTTSLREHPLAHEVLWQGGTLVGAHLGRPRDWFGGTDALAMSIQPVAEGWLAGHPFPLVLGEGDRLGNGKFFQAMRTAGVDLQVVHAHCPADVAEARRLERGSRYHDGWLAGRLTKVTRLAAQADVTVDTSQPLSDAVVGLAADLGLWVPAR